MERTEKLLKAIANVLITFAGLLGAIGVLYKTLLPEKNEENGA